VRIVILGAGALGTILAAHLVEDGHSVSLIARGGRASQLQDGGLEVGGLREIRTRCDVITDPVKAPAADLLILTAKTYDNEAAVASLAGDRFETVFSVANGVVKNAELAQGFGPDRVLGCMADTSGELLDTGAAKFTRNVMLHLGVPGGGSDKRAEAIAAAINASGINAMAVANIDTVEWSKFVGWTALLALSVITRLKTANFLSEPHCAGIAAAMIREMGSIAAAKQIEIVDQSPLPVASVIAGSVGEAREVLVGVGLEWLRTAPEHRMSSLQDLQRGKRLEVDETLGYAIAEAGRLDLAVPTLHTCYGLVAGINSALVPSLTQPRADRPSPG
jgi:2-dehydropantoate 2-reductase